MKTTHCLLLLTNNELQKSFCYHAVRKIGNQIKNDRVKIIPLFHYQSVKSVVYYYYCWHWGNEWWPIEYELSTRLGKTSPGVNKTFGEQFIARSVLANVPLRYFHVAWWAHLDYDINVFVCIMKLARLIGNIHVRYGRMHNLESV